MGLFGTYSPKICQSSLNIQENVTVFNRQKGCLIKLCEIFPNTTPYMGSNALVTHTQYG